MKRTSAGKRFTVHQSIDQGRFPHIAAADEGYVAHGVARHLRDLLGTAYELGSGDLHLGSGTPVGLFTPQKYEKIAITKNNPS